MKEVTEQGAYLQLAQLCARSEHCRHDADEKMRRWGMAADARERVVERLVSERYIDDERYARAYVADKVRFAKWGRRKVEQGLRLKHIDADVSRHVLDEVDDDTYLSILRPLLSQKRRTTRAQTDYELNRKLANFALSRGFTFDLISQCLDD